MLVTLSFTLCGILAMYVAAENLGGTEYLEIYVVAMLIDWFAIWPALAMWDYARHRSKELKVCHLIVD